MARPKAHELRSNGHLALILRMAYARHPPASQMVYGNESKGYFVLPEVFHSRPNTDLSFDREKNLQKIIFTF